MPEADLVAAVESAQTASLERMRQVEGLRAEIVEVFAQAGVRLERMRGGRYRAAVP
jgi:hypothetical protein